MLCGRAKRRPNYGAPNGPSVRDQGGLHRFVLVVAAGSSAGLVAGGRRASPIPSVAWRRSPMHTHNPVQIDFILIQDLLGIQSHLSLKISKY